MLYKIILVIIASYHGSIACEACQGSILKLVSEIFMVSFTTKNFVFKIVKRFGTRVRWSQSRRNYPRRCYWQSTRDPRTVWFKYWIQDRVWRWYEFVFLKKLDWLSRNHWRERKRIRYTPHRSRYVQSAVQSVACKLILFQIETWNTFTPSIAEIQT